MKKRSIIYRGSLFFDKRPEIFIKNSIESARKWFDGEIIVSTWKHQEKYLFGIDGIDKIVLTEDPGSGPIQQMNRQLISYMNGVENSNGDEADDEDDDDDEEMADGYLQKFNTDINRQYLTEFHPESIINNYDEINALSIVIRDINNNIIDKLHRTLPYLTKYERARVLGQRAKQINSGAKAFVKVPENVIDGYLIAEMELLQKRVPFIVRRPIPGGGCEYWKLRDLEIIGF